ncbi:MAG: DNA glycosylase [Candidatus Eiseniibacteriota bacterium]
MRLPVRGAIDLPLTLTCGQAFRWTPDGDAWSGVIGGSEVRVRQRKAGALAVESSGAPLDEAALARYFRLDEDPEIHLAHAEELRSLPGFEALLGLRLLRQDPWETLASFICSAAANIRKITACVEGIADGWGEPIADSSRRAFPPPEAIARVRDSQLRALGLGFRAPYVRGAARIIARDRDWSWERMRREPIDRARERLSSLPGVGPKIADCVLLFGLDRLEAYPVDRWIRRATLELSARRRANDAELLRWAVRLGPGRGYLQQILFHLRRTSGPLPALSTLRR